MAARRVAIFGPCENFEGTCDSTGTLVREPVVRTDPDHQKFQVWKAKGQNQLEASRVFNERFPRFLADLMDRPDDVTKLDTAADATAKATAAKELFDSLSSSDLKEAAKKQKDSTKQTQLKLIAENWDSLRAWLFGATVVDARNLPRRRMGLRWRLGPSRKDYMHFQDESIFDDLKSDQNNEKDKT